MGSQATHPFQQKDYFFKPTEGEVRFLPVDEYLCPIRYLDLEGLGYIEHYSVWEFLCIP